ncbi:MAG: tripartite tricarboxylate transporter TctB family protein [Armatimonadetes bacterium]|nr:tripartite tricarboxylate transporter TctB family protein [Armatimonadota bacterium]MBI2201746.1 tripartite tricarboxylate transporter TctB family protein [Armatimonadota bacterium]MBI2248022.1 tripartite tricarboxylate transporter TctB family protein [Armatimonadota bacterium]MBI2973285.1 tripartite tricarboxylate transporter TctB family protein [Armatimonadota bacterium]
MRKAETAGGVLLVLFALVMLREALRLPIGWTVSGPGAGFVPFWLSVGVAVAGAVILIQSLLPAPSAAEEAFIPAQAWKPLLVVFLPMAAVIAFINVLGIYLGGALYLVGYMRLVGRFRWLSVVVVSGLIPLVLFFIFEKWFLLPLPKGVFLERILYGR